MYATDVRNRSVIANVVENAIAILVSVVASVEVIRANAVIPVVMQVVDVALNANVIHVSVVIIADNLSDIANVVLNVKVIRANVAILAENQSDIVNVAGSAIIIRASVVEIVEVIHVNAVIPVAMQAVDVAIVAESIHVNAINKNPGE